MINIYQYPNCCLPYIQEVSQPSTLYLRIPFWTKPEGSNAMLNNQTLLLPLPGKLLVIYLFVLFVVHGVAIAVHLHTLLMKWIFQIFTLLRAIIFLQRRMSLLSITIAI